MSRTKTTYRVIDVKRSLGELLGQTVAEIVVRESFHGKPDDTPLNKTDIATLKSNLKEMFGCCGGVLYQLIELDKEVNG
jgi:hypothetical protein